MVKQRRSFPTITLACCFVFACQDDKLPSRNTPSIRPAIHEQTDTNRQDSNDPLPTTVADSNTENPGESQDPDEVETNPNPDDSPTPNQVNCDKLSHELPLYTHFDATKKGYVFGASDVASLPQDFKPTLDHYWADTFDEYFIADTNVISFARDLCRETNTEITFLHAKKSEARLPFEQGVSVIQGTVINGSIAHFVLPKNWSKKNAHKYPILAFSHYSANRELIGRHGKMIIETIAKSSVEGGAIAFIWNGGGSFNTTQNPKAQQQFADVIAYANTHYHGDANRIAIFGGSRGGGAALTLASNSNRYPYEVIFAYAIVPPTDFHAALNEVGPTFPALAPFVAGNLNDVTSWHPDWRHPGTGQTLKETWVTTFNDPNQVGAFDLVNALAETKTKVILQIHSHDEIVPYHLQYAYYRALVAAGGAVEAEAIILAGHGAGADYFPMETRMLEIMKKIIKGQSADTFITPGIRYKMIDHTTGKVKPLQTSDGKHPFTMNVPRLAFSGANNRIIAVGEVDTSVEIKLVNAIGIVAQRLTGTIADSGFIAFDLNDQPDGSYAYEVYIQKPDLSRQQIKSFHTPGSEIRTLLTNFQSLPSSETSAHGAMGQVRAKIPPPTAAIYTGWGLSEYSTKQVDADPNLTRFTFNVDKVHVGEQSTLDWESTNTDICYLVDEDGKKTGQDSAPSGSALNAPHDSEGQLILHGQCARDTKVSAAVTATLTIEAAPPKLTTLSFIPSVIDIGQRASLEWASSDANHCYLVDDQGSKLGNDYPPSGTLEGGPYDTKQQIHFKVQCARENVLSNTLSTTLEVK